MGATELYIRMRILAHADLIKGPGEKSSKRGNKRDLAAYRKAKGGTDHILLGDIHLEKTLRVFCLEYFREGGVAHFCVQYYHVRKLRHILSSAVP